MGYRLVRGVASLLVTNESDATQIEAPCGLVVSPVHKGEAIHYDEGCRIVYDVRYGRLPNGAAVILLLDPDEAFPGDEIVKLRCILEPYGAMDDGDIYTGKFKKVEGCPVCHTKHGCTGIEDEDEDGDEDEDDDEDDDGEEDDGDKEPVDEPPKGPQLRNRISQFFDAPVTQN